MRATLLDTPPHDLIASNHHESNKPPDPLILTACLALAGPASPAAADTAPGPGAPIQDGHAVGSWSRAWGSNPLVRHLAARQLTAPEAPAGAVAAALGEAIRSADRRTRTHRAYAEILHAIGPPAAAAFRRDLCCRRSRVAPAPEPGRRRPDPGYLFARPGRARRPGAPRPAGAQRAPGVYAGAAKRRGPWGRRHGTPSLSSCAPWSPASGTRPRTTCSRPPRPTPACAPATGRRPPRGGKPCGRSARSATPPHRRSPC